MSTCFQCDSHYESHTHLFFNCPNSRANPFLLEVAKHANPLLIQPRHQIGTSQKPHKNLHTTHHLGACYLTLRHQIGGHHRCHTKVYTPLTTLGLAMELSWITCFVYLDQEEQKTQAAQAQATRHCLGKSSETLASPSDQCVTGKSYCYIMEVAVLQRWETNLLTQRIQLLYYQITTQPHRKESISLLISLYFSVCISFFSDSLFISNENL